MKNRNALLDHIDEKGCKIAAEVGSYAGDYALEIMNRTHIEKLYCVDAFDYRNVSEKNQNNGAYDKFYKQLDKYIENGRIVPVKAISPQASESFVLDYFDFIYLDAGHSFMDVHIDLTCWFPTLKKGGIFAGHDYKNLGKKKRVKEAVNSFFGSKEYIINSTGPERVASFWVQT